MQHQMNTQGRQEASASPQPMQQPYMLCPVQYVYETPVIVPQPQENQIQQNQIVINVKNPPPWIQNRPQNQIVYVQQMPNNYQPYINPQMIQNPIYQPQMAYQIPMITQDNRQFIQIPNLTHHNMVQNPTQITNEEAEKMPLLTQILNQKDHHSIPQMVNNVRPNMPPIVNMIRPMQNQHVQTEIRGTNSKIRPQMLPQQILTINPMQHTQIVNQKQEIVNVTQVNMANDVPQHIMSKMPSSISVKTVNNGVAYPRKVLRPFDPKTAQKNLYYNPIIMPAPNNEVKTMNSIDKQQMRLNNNFQQSNATAPMQYALPVSNVSPMIRMTTANNIGIVNTYNRPVIQTTNANLHNNNGIKDLKTETVTTKNSESQTQTEKLMRSTVFVQARGRILRDKETVHNNPLKRTIDDSQKNQTESTQPQGKNNTNNLEEVSSKRMKTDEIIPKIPETNSSSNLTSSFPSNIQTQQTRITNLQAQSDRQQNIEQGNKEKTPATKMSTNVDEPKTIQQNVSAENLQKDCNINKSKDISGKEKEIESKNNSTVSSNTTNSNSIVKEDNLKSSVKKENITVLTHVVEGFIIQESNVAFPIQMPATEKDPKKQNGMMKTQNKNNMNTTDTKDNKSQNTWRYNNINTSIKSEKEVEFAIIEKESDDPFANVKKSTIESWTAEQLSAHLEKYNWRETASKLLDEEIDGESFLLVNKSQLEAIGIEETHAERIAEFISKG